MDPPGTTPLHTGATNGPKSPYFGNNVQKRRGRVGGLEIGIAGCARRSYGRVRVNELRGLPVLGCYSRSEQVQGW